jgi:AraC-like DNA-binding protein
LDPLSDVLSLKLGSYTSGGFEVVGDLAIQFPNMRASSAMRCSLSSAGFRWKAFPTRYYSRLVTVSFCRVACLFRSRPTCRSRRPTSGRFSHRRGVMAVPAEGRYIVGGHFALTGNHADILLQSLPPIVHIRKESDKAAKRWSLERMREEFHNPQPGGSLIVQQLAYMMLVQALRLHLAEGAKGGVGWLFALADKQMSAAITRMHEDPGYPWTLQILAEHVGMSRSIFALRFKETVGKTPMEYLTHWRMLLAGDRLQNSDDSLSAIALSLGYESESAFGKAFRRVMGCSPRRYSHGGTAAPRLPSAELELAAVR